MSKTVKCIVIGGSAGVGTLINKILNSLPKEFIIPIIIVRHTLHDDINETYMNILSDKFSINVCEPEDKEPLRDSTVYIAPAGYHLMIEEDMTFSLNVDEKIHYSRPSIDVLFESAASVFGEHLIGILLTGSNSDGAFGLEKIKTLGGTILIQNPETAEFSYMPESAVMRCNVDKTYIIEEIIEIIIEANKMRGEF